MKTRLALSTVIAVLALTTGCKDNQGSVEFFGICGIDDASKCSTSGKCDKVLVGRPFVYKLNPAGTANQLDLFVELDNQMPPNVDLSADRVNTNDFTIEEYTYKFSVSGASVPDNTYPQTLTIRAGSSQTPLIPIIPRDSLAVMGGGVVSVEIRARGRLQDGTSYEAGPWTVAVDVYPGQEPTLTCGVNLFPGKTGDIITAVCPHGGQTASYKCETP